MTELDEIRKRIDELDDRIIQLLRQRLGLGISTLGKKERVEDLKREDEIIAKLINNSVSKDEEQYLREVYKIIFTEGKRIQNNKIRS